MPTDITQACPSPFPQARNFALRGVAWSLALFGVMRVGWLETHAILPLTSLQGRLAVSWFGAPTLPIDVTLACSGTDALALCVGAILAYPVLWRMRLAGVGVGVALILALNTARIGTLGRAAATSWFEPLHVYVWPALLALAIAGYVFTWMRVADRRVADAGVRTAREPGPRATRLPTRLTRRFVVLTAALVLIFVAASPLYLESRRVLAVATFIASAAAWVLGLVGVQAAAAGNVLSTARGAFLVTQECISTPLIPVYLAAVLAYAPSWPRRALGLLAAGPLFVGLGIARVLVVALPAALIGSPLFLVHAFYQLLLAAVVVFLAACWRQGIGATAWRRALLGGALGGAVAYLLDPVATRVLASGFVVLQDPQGALAFLPAFQVGLYVALFVTAFEVLEWRPFATGLALLGVSLVALFAALYLILEYTGATPHVRDLRAWALAGPIVVVAGLLAFERHNARAGGGSD